MAAQPLGAEVRQRTASLLALHPVAALDADERARAAVCVALSSDDAGETRFYLTRRAASLRRHGGQWALPGGRLDPGESAEGAALRELEEELGVPHDAFEPIGRLDDYPTRSGFVITPVVAVARRPVEERPDPGEVAALHHVPLATLDRPDVPFLHEIPESDRPVLSMPVLEHRIHAPTAAILYQLLEVVVRGRTVRVAHYEQPRFAWR